MENLFSLVLLSAGEGRRYHSKKQFQKIKRVPLFLYSLDTFSKLREVQEIILVINLKEKFIYEKYISEYFQKNKKFLIKIKYSAGGSERYLSSFNGIRHCDKGSEFVLIHDVARPFINLIDLKNMFKLAIRKKVGIVPAEKLKDTIKVIKDEEYLKKNLKREELIAVSTPQIFPRQDILKVYQDFIKKKKKYIPTDDSELYLNYNYQTAYYLLKFNNPKLTYKNELEFFKSMV